MHALLAATFAIGEGAVAFTQPVFFIAVRMIFGGLCLLSYLYFFKREALRVTKHYGLLAQLIVFHIYIPYITEFWALQYVGSAKAALIYSLSPFITALFEYYLFSVRLTKRKLLGLLIGFVGFLPILLTCAPKECMADYFLLFSLPELAMIISAVSSCYGWILMKKAIVNKGYSPMLANGFGMLGGGGLALATSAAINNWNPLPTTNFGKTLLFAAILILLGNVIFYNLYGWMLHRYSATFLSFSGFIIPLFAALYQWLFFGESVGWPFFTTVAMVLLGLYIFYKDELIQPNSQKLNH